MKSLRDLNLAVTGITDQGVKRLANHSGITKLNLTVTGEIPIVFAV
jgi:hypothetical protein